MVLGVTSLPLLPVQLGRGSIFVSNKTLLKLLYNSWGRIPMTPDTRGATSAKAHRGICHIFCGHKQVFYPEITAQLLKLFYCLSTSSSVFVFRAAAPLSTHTCHFKRCEPRSAGEPNAPGVFWGRILISGQLMHKLLEKSTRLLFLKHTA